MSLWQTGHSARAEIESGGWEQTIIKAWRTFGSRVNENKTKQKSIEIKNKEINI